ncbi:MAG: nucleotide pyrophosphohydrolase [Planctomycetes bacterium]|nr:nucleotide pyrophosphohydrolase [Planctomycetota bacterium]
MRIAEFQKLIEDTFGQKDRKRGVENTFLWFSEEVGELARAINGRTTRENLRHEFADVLAWLTTLASIANVDLEEVARERYGKGCPRCHGVPCRCDEAKSRPQAARCG